MAKQEPAAGRGLARVHGVAITHANKPLWPGAGDRAPVTKIDLVRYFDAAGPWMIRHLRGRPCSIVRAPEGIGGRQFYQRHPAPGMRHGIKTIRLRGSRRPYIGIDRVEALVAVGQMGGIELHPWNCAPGRAEVPGRLVFDIDPAPGVGFDRVIEAALQIRARLEACHLTGFCKTTGGKGLHVVSPLARTRRGDPAWVDAREFARTLCTRIALDSPGRYVITPSMKSRSGKVFLDYLRNGDKATAVAPLSPRVRPGAPISMPLCWSQVRKGLDPKRFNIRTALAELRRSRAWADYDAAARPLPREWNRARR